ncbi:uncharacterized protein LOC141711550 isoform X3 [Apium graveolens]|uniref:uncharacterized protein LOC141711550 isoform X3 n=1 Tax=Apium graveolens TaxID=4045 RepID=UPI003D78E0B8
MVVGQTKKLLNERSCSETSSGIHLLEQVNSRLALGVGDVSSETSAALSTGECTNPFYRNVRSRINSSPQQDSLFPNATFWSSSISAPPQALRLFPRNNSLSPAAEYPIHSVPWPLPVKEEADWFLSLFSGWVIDRHIGI